MKRFIMFAILFLVGTSVYAEVNMPSAPVSYKKPVSENSSSQNMPGGTAYSTGGGSLKSQLDSLAMSALRAAENRDNKTMQTYIMKMMEKGVTQICQPQVVAKRTPKCPPIKMPLGNRVLSGSKCAQMCYVLNGKQYDVGYCK